MNYLCFIPKVSDAATLRITPPDWAAFRRATEARHPVTVRIHDFDDGDVPAGIRCWVLEAIPRPGTDGIARETIRQISQELDAFIEPRKVPLPQAA